MHKVDFLIVGQGLAGSTLALELLNRGKSIVVFDKPEENQSSLAAAGLFNPITGRKMKKTWRADVLFTYLHSFYIEAEKKLGAHFFHPMSLYHPFLSIEEQNEWMGKTTGQEMKFYIEEVLTDSRFGEHVHDPFGGLLLTRCGYVDVRNFMKAVRERLKEQHSFRDEFMDERELDIRDDTVGYQDFQAGKVIFCNGHGASTSMFFHSLPFRPLKGETLLVKTEQHFERIYNRGVYVVPTGEAYTSNAGATYDLQDLTPGISGAGRRELEKRLGALLSIPFNIVTQHWGIRPATIDRRPFLGHHPSLKNVVIFNGLGTKGVSLAPYFAKHLADWLTLGNKIDQEVDISRFRQAWGR